MIVALIHGQEIGRYLSNLLEIQVLRAKRAPHSAEPVRDATTAARLPRNQERDAERVAVQPR